MVFVCVCVEGVLLSHGPGDASRDTAWGQSWENPCPSARLHVCVLCSEDRDCVSLAH